MTSVTAILCLFASVVSQAQNSGGMADESAVKRAVEGIFDGLATLDMEKVQAHSTSDILLLEHGVIWNMDSLADNIEWMKRASGFKRTNKLDFFKTEVNANIAWVAYENTADIEINGKVIHVSWLESALVVKEKGKWKIRMLHSTVKERVVN